MKKQHSYQIIIASTNPAKRRKLEWILRDLPFQINRPQSVDQIVVEEIGSSHLENARAKVKVWSTLHSCLAIASDGGLVIPILGNRWNSIKTGRFAGPNATDSEKAAALLKLMEPYYGDDRKAYWVEAIAIANRGKITGSWQTQSLEGLITRTFDPTNLNEGFWASAIWHLPESKDAKSNSNEQELESPDDHWTKLRVVVRQHLTT